MSADLEWKDEKTEMESYPKYKPSGIDWIEEIPSQWNINKIKYCSTINDDVLPETTDENLEISYVDISSVQKGQIQSKEIYRFVDAPSRARRKVKHGDVIVSTVRTYLKAIARISYPEINMIVSTGFAVVRPNEIQSDYLGNLFLSEYLISEIISRSVGVSYPAINSSEIGDIKIPLPPSREQTAIAKYLDEKTTQIDKLIANKQKLIDLLKEERTTILNEAISGKGKNWERKKLKYVAKVQSSNVDKKSNEGETSIFLCNYVDVYKNEFIDNKINFMGATASEKEIEKFILREGDVLITKDSETPDDIANPALVTINFDNVICGYHLAQIRPKKKELSSIFLFRLFQSKEFNSHFETSANGVTRYGLPLDSITDVEIYFPSVKEQIKIATNIQIQSQRIATTISKIEKEIELMQEYRTALISEVVTGKMKIV